MKNQLPFFCCFLCCLPACFTGKKIAEPVPSAPKQEFSIALWDNFQTNPHNIMPGRPGFLQPKSGIRGGDFVLDSTRFTVGLIDLDADGRFNEVGDDRIFLTIYKNRKIRLNYIYGTPAMPIHAEDDTLQVDDRFFRVAFAAEDGTRLVIEPVGRPQSQSNVLKIITRLPDAVVENYAGGKTRLRDLIDHQHQTYLAFWALGDRKTEFENCPARHLPVIQQYADKVRLVSVHFTGHETDGMYQINKDFFFEMISKPWLTVKCDRDLYLQLQQDFTYYQGILTDTDGNIIEVYLNWKDMAENFPYMR